MSRVKIPMPVDAPVQTWRGEPIPEAQRRVRIRDFQSASWGGRIESAHVVGTVLWAEARKRTTYRLDQRGQEPQIVTSTSETLLIQLADGRQARLDGSNLVDSWSYVTDEEAAEADVLRAEAQGLLERAEAAGDTAVGRELREAAQRLYERLGEPTPKPPPVLGPKRASVLWLIAEQDEVWWPKGRGPVRLEDMTPQHRANTLRLLRRNCLMTHFAWTNQFLGAPEDVIDEVFRETPEKWIERQPLVRRLARLVAEDEKD